VTNLNTSPLLAGEINKVMKKIFSSILRLSIAYSKFGVIIFTLTLFKTVVNADTNNKYSSSSLNYLEFHSFCIGEQQNIRRENFCPKNFLNVDKKINSNPLNINHEKKRRKV